MRADGIAILSMEDQAKGTGGRLGIVKADGIAILSVEDQAKGTGGQEEGSTTKEMKIDNLIL